MHELTVFKNDCLICGEELIYNDIARPMECSFCGEISETRTKCSKGHFICDRCHSLGANDFIEEYCINSISKDPLGMASDIMKHPAVKMHGPEHHFLVPAVLFTAYYNSTRQNDLKKKMIMEARKRSKPVLGGFCGFQGACGAAIGTGIFISLISDSTPLSKESWSLANKMTSTALEEVAEYGGPRCCKRDTFLCIIAAVKFQGFISMSKYPFKADSSALLAR